MSQPQATAPATFRMPGSEFLGRVREGGIIYPFILLFIVLAIWKGSTFYGRTNLLEILDQQSATLIIAAAGTMVLIAGGIDLSVGATYALCQVIAMKMAISGNPVAAIVVGVIIGIAVGAANGVITTFFRINSLIATLATSFVITGGAALITGRQPDHQLLGDRVRELRAHAVPRRDDGGMDDDRRGHHPRGRAGADDGGRYMYAAGSNAEASRLAGVRVQWIKLVTFAISGGAAALGGIIDSARVLSASSSNGGTALTFTVLAGIVVGGTSILGGEGAIWRTVIGVLFIAMIGNGFTLLGWNPLYEQITLGLILLLAVGGDAWSRLRTT